MRHGFIEPALVALASVPLLFAAAAGEAQRPRPELSETLRVDLVSLDVFATDRKGAALADLEREDFQVLEDGRRVKLTHFSRGADADAELSIVVYVDATHLDEDSKKAALRSIRSALQEPMAGRELEVMVVAFDGALRMEQSFTNDPALVGAALHRIGDRQTPPSESLALERSTRAAVEDSMQMLHAGGGSEILARNSMDAIFGAARSYAEVAGREAARSVDALSALAAALGARQGRKAVFVVADGLVMRPLEELISTLTRLIMRRGSGSERAGELSDASVSPVVDARPGGGSAGVSGFTTKSVDFSVARLQEGVRPFAATARFEQLAALANSSRLTLYPIRPAAPAASSGLGNRSGGSEGDRPLSDLQEGVELLADATGGRALQAAEAVTDFLAQTLTGPEGVYALGFPANDRSEGAVHTLDVKVKGGARLRHRKSYVSRSELGRLADRAAAALTLGWIDNPHQVEVSLDKRSRTDNGDWDVSLILQFPIGSFELVHEDGFQRFAGKVAAVTLDPRRGLSPPVFLDLPLRIPDADVEAARSQYYAARINLRLAAGPQQIAIGVWDEAARVGSFVRRDLDAGETGGGRRGDDPTP